MLIAMCGYVLAIGVVSADGCRAKDAGKTSINNFYFAGHAKYIVREALRASRLNMWVCSPGMVAKAERLISWVLPDCVIVPVWDLLRRL